MVAVLIPYLTDSIFNDTIQSMVEELSGASTTVMLGLTGVSARRTEDLIRAALSRRVDAIIFTGPVTPEVEAMVRRSPALFIEVWDLPKEPIGLAVGFSHEAAGRDVARFLMSRGYRRPHLVTASGTRAQMRRDGFFAEWPAAEGIALTESSVEVPSRFGHARRIFAEIRRLPDMPDVVVCGSDYLAQGSSSRQWRPDCACPRILPWWVSATVRSRGKCGRRSRRSKSMARGSRAKPSPRSASMAAASHCGNAGSTWDFA
jgi:LacI family gluconate utilization system Gnt-I transcriptional repressor